MGLVKICNHKRANAPFFVEQAGVSLYSLEELAYFLCHNACLADRRFFDERLCRWLDAEAGCQKLAERLRDGIARGNGLSKLVLLIEQEAGLYSVHELEELKKSLKGLGALQEQERMKLRADGLLRNRNEWAAVDEYRRILRMHQNSRLGMAFYGAVWNNLGVCYARQFLFDEAAECFEAADAYHPDEEAKRQAGLARALAKGQKPDRGQTAAEFADPGRQLLKWEREYRVRLKP